MRHFVRVKASRAEEVRRWLLENGLLDRNTRPMKEGDHVLFPVVEPPPGFEVVMREGKPFGRRGSYRDYVNVPPDVIPHLPTSFDIVGDIAIVKIPDALMEYAEEIGRGIARAHRNVRLVAMDLGVTGVERIRRLVPVYGEGAFETVHREHGVRIYLDVSRVYFSPRLATERWRVQEQVSDGETVLDMFAGAGPFSLVIASRKRVVIHAVDVNPVAVEYLRKNIAANRLRGTIIPHEGDAREVVPEIGTKFDRVIMNLPHSAYLFGETAGNVSRRGTAIHLHCIGDARERVEMLRVFLRDLRKWGLTPKVRYARKVRDYSPAKRHFVYDIISI